MKRKLFAITLVLALLTSVYTAYACLSTRGLRVYLMGTRLGTVLAASWQYTLLAAVVLWIPGIVVLLRRGAGRKGRAAALQGVEPTEVLAEGPTGTERLEPRRGTAQAAGTVGSREGQRHTAPLVAQRQAPAVGEMEPTELLEPRHGVEATEILEPAGDGAGDAELLEPRRGAAESAAPVPPADDAGGTGWIEEPATEEDPPGETVPEGVAATEFIPAEPAPTEFIPAEPVPAEVAPAEPVPTEFIPPEPVPVEVAPPEPVVVEPSRPAQEQTHLPKTGASAAPAQQTKPRFCTHCGYPVKGNFCSRCGTKVNR